MQHDAKSKYEALCRQEESIPVFQQPWWLDAVCGGHDRWQVVLAEEDNTITGAMVYYQTRKMGQTWLKMPLLTSNWGPWIRPAAQQKSSSRLHYEHDVYASLIKQLPSFHYFNQRFHPVITNGLPFYWNAFTLQTRYTYVIDDLRDLKAVHDGFNTNIKRQLKKAEAQLRIRETEDIGQFYVLNKKTFERQKTAIPYTLDFLKTLDAACVASNSRKIWLAVDEQNNVHGSLYLVWNKHSAYYLMGGIDPAFSSGAFSLLMWNAIQFASQVTGRFDFEGSMIESIERFFRSFGARQVPYLHVQKINSPVLKLLFAFRN